MSTWDNKLIKGSQVESDLLALAKPIFRGINSRPSSTTYGYTHIGTINVTDGNKRGNIALDVYAGYQCSHLHCISATFGYLNETAIRAVYSAYAPTDAERGRFKLCYKFADGHTADSPKIDVWLIDTNSSAASTRRCACVVHSVAGVTWTDGTQTSTTTLPANLVDFDAAHPYGVLSVAYGGTGASTAKGAEYNILTGLGTELTTAVQDTYKIPFVLNTQSEQNGRIAGYRTASRLWDYTYGKLTTTRGLPFGNFAVLDNTTTLTEIGKFTMKGPSGRVDKNIMAVFQIAYTDNYNVATSYLNVLIATGVTADTNNNITDFGVGDFIAYHRSSPSLSAYKDVRVYYKIVDGEVKIYCGLSANSTNRSCRCVWTVQSGRMDFIATNVAVDTRPSNLVAATNVMDVTGTGGDDSTPVYVNSAGQVKPCTNVDTMVGIIARQINGSSTTGLARLGQFVYSSGTSNIRAQATFRISATSSSKSTRCEFLVRFAFQVNVTDGKITGFSSSDIYTYKKVKTASPAIHVYYTLTNAGVINVYVGPESATSSASFRYIWSVQSVDMGVKFVVQNLGNEITTYPGNMTQVTELIEPHGTGGSNGTAVWISPDGEVKECTNLTASRASYAVSAGTAETADNALAVNGYKIVVGSYGSESNTIYFS